MRWPWTQKSTLGLGPLAGDPTAAQLLPGPAAGPVETPRVAQELDLRVYGRTGLKQWSGYVDEEWHSRLRGDRWLETAIEMRDDPTVSGILFRIETILVRTGIEPRQADESSLEAERAARFLEECIEDMGHTWREHLVEACSVLWAGWALFEPCFKRRGGITPDPDTSSRFTDGRVGWSKFAIRAQESRLRWEFAPDGDLLGMVQLAPPDYVLRFLPVGPKLLHYRMRQTKDNPEGRALIRPMFVSWYFVKRIREIEAIAIEREGAGVLVMEIPPEYLASTASAAQVNTLASIKEQARQFRQGENACLVMPSSRIDGKETGWVARLMTSGGARQIPTSDVIRRHQADMAMALMAEAMFLGTDKVGSFSMHSDKTALLMLMIDGILDQFCETLNRQLIPPLMRFNGVPEHAWPRFGHNAVRRVDLTELAAFLAPMLQAGAIMPDAETESYLRELSSLPQREDHGVAGLSLPGTEGTQHPQQGGASENPGLTIQYLSLAAQRAVEAGDLVLARDIGAKISALLATIGGPTGPTRGP